MLQREDLHLALSILFLILCAVLCSGIILYIILLHNPNDVTVWIGLFSIPVLLIIMQKIMQNLSH